MAAVYDVVALSRDRVLMRSSTESKIVHQPFWGAVLPVADGTSTADEIVDQLEATVPLAHTYYALMCLEREKILVEAPAAQDPAELHSVVMTGDYLDPALAELARCATDDRPFIPIRISGDSIWLGPVIRSGGGEVWAALLHRLRRNLYDVSKRVFFPPSEGALKTAGCWIPRIVECGQPSLWTGMAGDSTPRIHSFLPSLNATVRERLENAMSPITGLVPVVERLTQDPVFVYQALEFHPASATAGKGLDEESALLSCMAEVAERQSMMWTGREPVRRAAYRDVAEDAMHPSALAHWSLRQRASAGIQELPPNREIDWVEAHALGENRVRYLPAALCFHGHPDAPLMGLSADSNGCAAGPSWEEAVTRGFLELVERDAFAIWWYNRIPRSAFPQQEVDAVPAACRIRDHLRQIGGALTILDVTTDLGIPVAVAITTGPDGIPRDIGFGAAFDRATAIHRAALEAGQLIATPQRRVWEWLRTAFQLDPAYLRALPPSPHAEPRFHTVLEAAAELEILVVDLTRKDIGIPVARVVSRTLRPPWARLGTGRLYDVPVRCGWLARPRTEDELNPIPFIL